MLLKMALRNIIRNRRRSLLTGMMMSGGFVFISISLGFLDGSYGAIISLFTGQHTGHIQITDKSYIKTPSLYKTIHNFETVLTDLSKNKSIRALAPRIHSEALVYYKSATFGAEVVGIDPIAEDAATAYSRRILNGSALSETSGYDVLVGKTLARVLQVGIGDDIVLISQGADGSIANDIFRVIGSVGTEQEGRDDYRIYMPLKTAAEFFSLYHQAHEISVHLYDFNLASRISDSLVDSDSALVARPWQEVESDFYRTMQLDRQGNDVSILILMLMVGIGVLNTILMSTLERSREFGVLKALGTHPAHIFFMIMSEGLILSVFAAALGSLVSTIINEYLSQSGIQFAEPVSFAGMKISEFRSSVTSGTILFPSCVIIFTTLLASLYPALKSSKSSVSDALREF
ncbi:MAG: ABC transporter permease [Deltaproteobacteria bacterium]|nr:ABC transporter permease [Deltaproteobacteria bacterium]